MSPLEIAAGRLRATVTGGDWLTVSSLRFDGVELLSAPDPLPLPYRVHGQRAGITLLHPWANRLGGDRFTCAGAEMRLDDAGARGVQRDPDGLAIHGLRIPGAWRVGRGDADASACRATATFAAQPAFPFPHAVAVEFRLADPATLSVQTTLTATGDGVVPVSFGWHPYFLADRSGGIALELPAREAPSARIELRDQSFDDGFAGVADGAEFVLAGPERTLRVVHESGYPCGQLFAPADRPVVSLEPMTARSDALRSDPKVGLVAPGGSFTATWRLEVQATPAPPAATT